jgi:restriction system protein
VLSVLAPLLGLAALAGAASAVAVHADAPPLGGGSWGWLGDSALVLDAAAALACLGAPAEIRHERIRRAGMGSVDAMSGPEFEARLAALFADLGYSVTATGQRGDFGADLLLEGGGERLAVQAKRYAGAVGIEAVQQVIGATRYYDADRALVVTNSTCTPAAVELATAHGVELIEREALVGLLALHPLVEKGPPAPLRLAREIGGGVVLVCFASKKVLGLVWRALGLLFRAPSSRRGLRR